MYHTYILINKKGDKTYTGSTSKDPARRLIEHNSGQVKSSRHYIPYEILHVEAFDSLLEARRKEKYYKSTAGRKKLSEFIDRRS